MYPPAHMKLITAPLRVFHERGAWLCFAFSHRTYEHVVCLQLWQTVRCLVQQNSSVVQASRSTCHTEWAPVSDGYACHVVQLPRGVCRKFQSSQCSGSFCFTRSVRLSCLIRISTVRRSASEASLARMSPSPSPSQTSSCTSFSALSPVIDIGLRGGVPSASLTCKYE